MIAHWKNLVYAFGILKVYQVFIKQLYDSYILLIILFFIPSNVPIHSEIWV